MKLAINITMAVLLALVGLAAIALGMFSNFLFIFILLVLPAEILLLLWRLFRGTLETRFWRTPMAQDLRLHWVQAINGGILWLLSALILHLCLIPAQFTPLVYSSLRILIWGAPAILILLELFPGKRVPVATNLVFAAGSVFMAIQFIAIYQPVSKAAGVVLSAPFQGDWVVVQGGPSTLINHHFGLACQRDALDLARIVNGQVRTGPDGKLGSYPSWGVPLYSPSDGRIVKAVNNREDNPIGKSDSEIIIGNHLVLDIGEGRFVLMAHLQKGSVLVSPGQSVHAGELVAKCGNSGNTSLPHLHLQVQNQPDVLAAGTKTFPILIRNASRNRAGSELNGEPFFVRRNDVIESRRP